MKVIRGPEENTDKTGDQQKVSETPVSDFEKILEDLAKKNPEMGYFVDQYRKGYDEFLAKNTSQKCLRVVKK